MVEETVINKLEAQIIVVSATSMFRLLEIDTDAFTLYQFYIVTAKRQAIALGQYTNKIFANDTYCLRGLRWGKDRFYKAKRKLEAEDFIEQIIRRKEDGTIEGHYLLINYLINDSHPQSSNTESGSYKPQSSKPEGGFQDTNADNKKLNAGNKKNMPATNDRPIKNPNEQLLSSEETHSKKGPLSEVRLWEIAMEKNVPLSAVKETHKRILEDITGENRYKLKNVNLALQKWISMGISRGNIREMNEIEKMDLQTDHPDEVARRRKKWRELEEKGIL